MTDELGDRLMAGFALQDDACLRPGEEFRLVRARAAQIERRQRKRRRLLLVAAVVALVLVVPGVAVSRALVDRFFGTPADPSLGDYIGLVLKSTSGNSFATPPRYVAGVRTSRGLVLVWAARRADGAQCSGVQAAFGDADVVRMKLAGRTIADNGIACGGGLEPLSSSNAGLSIGQGLGGVHVYYGQVPARVRAVRVTYEDGRTQTVVPLGGWVIVAFARETERIGHRPLLEQAFGARNRTLATVRLNPWNYGGTESPPPSLEGAGTTLLQAFATPAGPAALRLSAPGHGWQLRQCAGVVAAGRSTPILCDYPADRDPAAPGPRTNLFMYGPHFSDFVIAVARRIDGAWLVAEDGSVRSARVARFSLAGAPEGLIVAAMPGGKTLAGIVGSRDGRIVGAVLTRESRSPGGLTGPCFLETGGAGAPSPTVACRALIERARQAATGSP